MLHEEAKACVAVPQPLWLRGAYDPMDRLEKPAFLYLFVSCPPSQPVFHPEFLLSELLLLQLPEFPLKPQSSEVVLRQGLFGPLLGQFESVWVFSDTKGESFLGGGSLTFSLFSLEPQVRGQSRRTGGSRRLHT